MKKVYLLILTILFIIPFKVKAATTPRVLTLEAKSTGTTIKYNGTIEEGSHAVMCKLYNSDKEEVDLLSSAVDNKEFSGSFTVSESDKYKVACANYEGGDIKEVEVKMVVDKTNPPTYDAGITASIIVLAVGIIGIVGVLVYLKKKKNIETK